MDGEKAAESESEGQGRHNYAPYFGFVVFEVFFIPLSFFIPLLCSLLISLKMCQFDSSLTKLWMIYVKRLWEKKRVRQDLRDSFKVATLQLTRVTCIGYHLNDCWINKRFLKNSWNVFLRYIKCNQRKLNSCTWLRIIWGLFKSKL